MTIPATAASRVLPEMGASTFTDTLRPSYSKVRLPWLPDGPMRTWWSGRSSGFLGFTDYLG
jgi:hypothetical protein